MYSRNFTASETDQAQCRCMQSTIFDKVLHLEIRCFVSRVSKFDNLPLICVHGVCRPYN